MASNWIIKSVPLGEPLPGMLIHTVTDLCGWGSMTDSAEQMIQRWEREEAKWTSTMP